MDSPDTSRTPGTPSTTMDGEDRKALDVLTARLRSLLPEAYQDSYDDLQPVSMGSAGLKFGADGKVAWDEIWQSFCDLAMAGGPPHKGTLLEHGSRAAIDAAPARYADVAEEICRGVSMAADLVADPSPVPGWVRVQCFSGGMAAWLLRAIVMENVAVRREGLKLDLPAAPHFRLEKEIKNVVTVIAKTTHYWLGHMPREQRQAITTLLADIDAESPLVEPLRAAADDDGQAGVYRAAVDRLAAAIERRTGLRASSLRYAGWLGVECPSVADAVWMMRMLIVSNILARREGAVLFVPIDPARDPDGEAVAQAVARIHRLHRLAGAGTHASAAR